MPSPTIIWFLVALGWIAVALVAVTVLSGINETFDVDVNERDFRREE